MNISKNQSFPKEDLTEKEMAELTLLHDEAMATSQVEEDWMLLTIIKEERKNLSRKYFHQFSNYKPEDICDLCNQYFYDKGNLQKHI